MRFSTAARVKLTVVGVMVFMVLETIYMQLFKMVDFYGRELAHFVPNAGTPAYSPDFPSMFGYYFLMAFGYVYFVFPRVASSNTQSQLTEGAIFGFVLGGAMNLCNFAFLGGVWPQSVTIADTLWSAAAGGLVTVLTLRIAKQFKLA